MKKLKRVLSVVLAVLMACSVLSISAVAYSSTRTYVYSQPIRAETRRFEAYNGNAKVYYYNSSMDRASGNYFDYDYIYFHDGQGAINRKVNAFRTPSSIYYKIEADGIRFTPSQGVLFPRVQLD